MWTRIKHVFNLMGDAFAVSNSGEMLSKKQKGNILRKNKKNTPPRLISRPKLRLIIGEKPHRKIDAALPPEDQPTKNKNGTN